MSLVKHIKSSPGPSLLVDRGDGLGCERQQKIVTEEQIMILPSAWKELLYRVCCQSTNLFWSKGRTVYDFFILLISCTNSLLRNSPFPAPAQHSGLWLQLPAWSCKQGDEVWKRVLRVFFLNNDKPIAVTKN